jgi:hypothetical protein
MSNCTVSILYVYLMRMSYYMFRCLCPIIREYSHATYLKIQLQYYYDIVAYGFNSVAYRRSELWGCTSVNRARLQCCCC